jgi:hypothetical protein
MLKGASRADSGGTIEHLLTRSATGGHFRGLTANAYASERTFDGMGQKVTDKHFLQLADSLQQWRKQEFDPSTAPKMPTLGLSINIQNNNSNNSNPSSVNSSASGTPQGLSLNTLMNPVRSSPRSKNDFGTSAASSSSSSSSSQSAVGSANGMDKYQHILKNNRLKRKKLSKKMVNGLADLSYNTSERSGDNNNGNGDDSKVEDNEFGFPDTSDFNIEMNGVMLNDEAVSNGNGNGNSNSNNNNNNNNGHGSVYHSAANSGDMQMQVQRRGGEQKRFLLTDTQLKLLSTHEFMEHIVTDLSHFGTLNVHEDELILRSLKSNRTLDYVQKLERRLGALWTIEQIQQTMREMGYGEDDIQSHNAVIRFLNKMNSVVKLDLSSDGEDVVKEWVGYIRAFNRHFKQHDA